MKKSWRLLSLLLVLCVLLGGYVIIKNNNSKKNSKKSTTPAANSDKTENVYSVDETKVKQVRIKSKDADIIIEKSGKEWKVNELGDKADQTSVQGEVSTLTNISAQRVIEKDAKDLAQYGLDKPSVVVTIGLNDGKKQVIQLGNQAVGNFYYLKLADKNTVYAVGSNYGQSFKYTLNDLRNKKLGTIDPNNITYMDLKYRNGKEAEFKRNLGTDAGYAPYKLYKYYKEIQGVSGDKFGEAVKSLTEIDFEDVVEENAKNLSKYGLDKPVLAMTVKDRAKNEVKLLIGNQKDSGTVYIKEPNSNTVYTMDSTSVEPLIKLDVFSVTDKFANIVNIDDVDKVDIKSKDANYEININRTIKKATKKGEKDETIAKYYINNKQIKEDKFKDYYQILIGLVVDTENDKSPKGNPEVITTFHLNKGKDIVVKYYNYNDDFYIVDKNGLSQFLIAKDKVKSMLDSTAKMIK